jgi:YebC/PmpR family DNA-binding regulatory protein
MAGHSKWANIKHRKSKQDAVKGKIFTKLIREISVAAKGGQDVTANARLRLAVDKALSYNMPRDTIDRAIKRGASSNNEAKMTEIFYEGYGSYGVAILVQCLTANRNRTAGEIRHLFTKHSGNLGTTGSVSYLFKQLGLICLAPGTDVEQVMQLILDLGIEDINIADDDSIEITTTAEKFGEVKAILERANFNIVAAEVSMFPTTQLKLEPEESIKITELIDAFEALDDVQNVYTNVDFSPAG